MTRITLGTRHGGYLHHHIATAREWKASGASVIITGSQYSAAAIQVAYAKRIGVPVTYKRQWGMFTPYLYFHAAKVDGVPVSDSYDRLVEYLGVRMAAVIGVPPVKGWRKVAPEQLGIHRAGK